MFSQKLQILFYTCIKYLAIFIYIFRLDFINNLFNIIMVVELFITVLMKFQNFLYNAHNIFIKSSQSVQEFSKSVSCMY